MKKVIIAILFMFTISLLISGCWKKSNDTKYVYKTGETLKYKFWMSQQTDFSDKSKPAQRLLVRFFCNVTPEKTDDDVTTLKLTIEDAGATVATEEGRNPLGQFRALNKLSYTIKQKSDGTIVEIINNTEPDPSIASYSKTLNQTFKEIFPTLPEKLAEGTSWHRQTKTEHEVFGYGKTISTTKTALMAGKEKDFEGYKPVEIMATFDIDFDTKKQNKPNENTTFSKFASSGSGRGAYYFDKKAGILVAAKYDTAVDVEAEMKQEDTAVPNSYTVKSHIEFQLVTNQQAKVQK